MYRPVFVVFEALHTYPEYQQYFPVEYAPEVFEIDADKELTQVQPALSSRSLHEACKIVESQYFHLSAAVRLPRFAMMLDDGKILNPIIKNLFSFVINRAESWIQTKMPTGSAIISSTISPDRYFHQHASY